MSRLVAAVLLLVLVGCDPAGSPTPSTSPGASGTASAPAASSGPVTSAEEAAARVVASDPRFAGISARDPDLIGQCCFSTVTSTDSGYEVTIEIGWGDCPAGCIDRHHWVYAVSRDGAIRLLREDGPPVPADVPGGGGTTGALPSVPPGVIGIRGRATAGPVCPVVRPNDPACADRPVVGAVVHVIDERGTEVATLETDANGFFVVTLPSGQYEVRPDPVDGLMGTAAAVQVAVASTIEDVVLAYDTGIR